MDPEKLYKAYSDAGFTFTKDLITNYCISLYTKPFVILSGISGTGKTKIAQLFMPFEKDESSSTRGSEPRILYPSEEGYITITLTEGILNGDGRGNFRASDLPMLLTNEEFTEYQKERDELIESGRADNFSSTYSFKIFLDAIEYTVSFYVQRAISPLIRVRFKSKRTDSHRYDLQPILRAKYQVGQVLKLKKIYENSFELVETSDTDIELESVSKPITYENNICLIPVKSDWTDPSGILGFYNVIEHKYHIGPFLKHLLYAQANPEVPFFLILDEMNLSKIEYYLSDVLSVMETRLPNSVGLEGFHAEKIILHSAAGSDDYIATDDEYFDIISSKIGIPRNFYITGTINIDETTYIPSPKVLDRANIIEFNKVNLEQYFFDHNQTDSSSFILKEIPDFAMPVLPTIQYARSIPEDAKNLIISINATLKKYNLHFGYRVASEISLYIINALRYTVDENSQLFLMLDLQISQKILPKLSGAQSRIEKPVVELFNLLTDENIDINRIVSSEIEGFSLDSTRYPISVGKLKNLYKRLVSYGFASSIE